MILLITFGFLISPFYDANFTSLPARSVSLFSNPAGLGVNTGAEAFATYHLDSDIITTGASMGNLGFGYRKNDTLDFYQVGVGYKLPGAFSLGYSYEFGDTSIHVLGIECRPSGQFVLGYKTTLGETNYMFGGISILPYGDYVVLSLELEYEGNDSIFTFYYGTRIKPYKGMSAFFIADEDFDWHAGIEISLGYAKICGMYSYEEEKFSAGLLVSAQRYETFVSQ
ncbi:MAG: hypothetical protein JSU64_07665 [candidate division WOR-3 bacterium]|nr:MAG: hypothetical protein JSU64_07665 [candidate division WOR-3 bacterium]